MRGRGPVECKGMWWMGRLCRGGGWWICLAGLPGGQVVEGRVRGSRVGSALVGQGSWRRVLLMIWRLVHWLLPVREALGMVSRPRGCVRVHLVEALLREQAWRGRQQMWQVQAAHSGKAKLGLLQHQGMEGTLLSG